MKRICQTCRKPKNWPRPNPTNRPRSISVNSKRLLRKPFFHGDCTGPVRHVKQVEMSWPEDSPRMSHAHETSGAVGDCTGPVRHVKQVEMSWRIVSPGVSDAHQTSGAVGDCTGPVRHVKQVEMSWPEASASMSDAHETSGAVPLRQPQPTHDHHHSTLNQSRQHGRYSLTRHRDSFINNVATKLCWHPASAC